MLDIHWLCYPADFQDEVGNLVGMRDQRKMARLHFDSLDAMGGWFWCVGRWAAVITFCCAVMTIVIGLALFL